MTSAAGSPAPDPVYPRSRLARWVATAATFAIPQAAAPIAFALIVLPITGDPSSGAALILALTLAQIIGAVPVTRLGRRFDPVSFFRALVVIRTIGLAGVAVLGGLRAPLPIVIAAAAFAGLVTGAAWGYQRAILNGIVTPDRLSRAIGISATLNEVTFVASPVIASVLGSFSPVAAVVALTVLGFAPFLLIPRPVVPLPVTPSAPDTRVLTRPILLWLICAGINELALAGIEIGAVAQAVRYGLAPSLGVIFTVSLCIASILGGVWVSTRTIVFGRRTILLLALSTAAGASLVAFGGSIVAAMVGAVLTGIVLAPLSTTYSLLLDELAAPERRPEVFALLRTSISIGIIVMSALIAFAPLVVALSIAAVLAFGVVATMAVGLIVRPS